MLVPGLSYARLATSLLLLDNKSLVSFIFFFFFFFFFFAFLFNDSQLLNDGESVR